MDNKDRINALVNKFSDGKVSDFEKRIKVKPTRIDKLIKRNSKISLDIVRKIKESFPQVNEEWVEAGLGDMLLSEHDLVVEAPARKVYKKIGHSADKVNFYDVDFAMGDIQFFDGDEIITPAYTMDIPEFAGCTAFRGYGESMEPLIHGGSILFGTKLSDWQSHLEFGQIYGIICQDNRRYLKYIRRHNEMSKTHFLLKSENPEYDDMDLPKNVIKHIWLIHGWINKRT